jgi:hypothetical protein
MWRKSISSLVLILLGSLVLAAQSEAVDFTFNPSLSLRGEYDDNINFSRYDVKSDWIGILIPAFKFDWKTPRFDLNSSAEVEIRRYDDYTDYNDEYQRYRIETDYRLTERLSLLAGASFTRDSTLDSELEETGVVDRFYRRDRYSFNCGLNYQLTERMATGLDYNYSDTDYHSPTDQDYDTHHISGHLSYAFADRRNQIFINPTYYHYHSDRSQVDNYGLSLGWVHDFSETLKFNCYLGVRYTDTEYEWFQPQLFFDPSSGQFYWRMVKHTESENDVGGTANVSLSGKTELSTYSVGYSRDLSYTSDGSPIDKNRFFATFSRRLSRRLNCGLESSLYFSKSSDNFSKGRRISIYEDTVYYYLQPHISWMITPDWSLRLAYNYARNRDKTLSNRRSYDRQRCWLTLVGHFPRLLD